MHFSGLQRPVAIKGGIWVRRSLSVRVRNDLQWSRERIWIFLLAPNVLFSPVSMSRKIVLLAAGGCVLIGLAAWYFLRGQSSIQYRTVTVAHGDINITVSATGNPNAVVTVQVGTQVSGIILALFADFNSKVTKGELIARIDPAPFQTKVDQAQANVDSANAAVANAQSVILQATASVQAANSSLAAAKANVVKAQAVTDDTKAKVDRRVIMVQQGADAAEDLETAQTTWKSAVADYNAAVAQQHALEDNVKVAQDQLKVANSVLTANQDQVKQFAAALESAKIDLDHTNITAPVDGVVVSRNVDVGQTVAASLAAPTLFLIAQDMTKMQVDTNVSEADVGRVHAGQQGTFTVDAYPGLVFKGTVTAVREAPINVQNVITYDAVIGVSNPDLKLFPGMTANVKILVDQRPNVLRVLNAALRYHPATQTSLPASAGKAAGNGPAPEQAVWILDADNKPRRVVVTTGQSDGNYTEVTGGSLKDGDKVIVAALAKAAPASNASPAPQGKGPSL
jgi:HlyD family secretion protein